jgi:hypothetical protein
VRAAQHGGQPVELLLERLQPIVSRMHIDFYADDGEGEVERLLGLVATRYEREASPNDDFVVLVDPDGNRFCVVD